MASTAPPTHNYHMGAIRKLPHIAVAAIVAAVVYVLVWHPWGLLYALGVHPYPASSSTPWTYQMWSGIIPALTVLTLFGSLGGFYHLHNCHWKGCLRLGKHRLGGTPWCTVHVGYASKETTDSDRLDRIISLLELANVGRDC